MKEIYLAGGCFWGVEEYFSLVPGVTDAEQAKHGPDHDGHLHACHMVVENAAF